MGSTNSAILEIYPDIRIKISNKWKYKYNDILKKAYEQGNLNIITSLFSFDKIKSHILSDVHLQTEMCVNACINNRVDVIKYLYEDGKFEKHIFEFCIVDTCKMISICDCIDSVKYIFEIIKIDINIFYSNWNNMCESAYENGHLQVCKYMLSKFVGLENFCYGRNECCQWACKYFDMVKYLVEVIKMNENDFKNCIFNNESANYLNKNVLNQRSLILCNAEKNLFRIN